MATVNATLIKSVMGAAGFVARLFPDPDADPLLEAREHVGKPYPRVDGRLKVTGEARYTADYAPDNLAYAALVYSAIAKGKITHIDSEAAEKLPGVLTVMTHHNAPRLQKSTGALGVSLTNPTAGSSTTLPIMQSGAIFWNGQAVAVVVAETPELATYAAGMIQVTYEAEPAALSLAAGKSNAFVPDHVLFQSPDVRVGDAEAALADAPVRVDERYETPAENHNAMEPHAGVAHWLADDQLVVYASTQFALGTRDALAQLFGLKPKQVRIITDFVGGSFGSKGATWSNLPLTVAAAKLTGRPVKLTLTREGVNRLVGGRTMTDQRVALGASADGKLVSLIHSGYTMCTTDVYAEQFTLATRHMYASPTLHINQQVVPLDRVQNSYMRAPGDTPGLFAVESAMDELANQLQMDPVALRLQNEPDKDPMDGLAFSSRYLREAYALGAEKFGWQPGPAQPGTRRENGWLIGTGMAASYNAVLQLSMTVIVRITAEGMVTVRTSTVEIGVGLATSQIQHVAERFAVSPAQVRFIQGDTDLPPAPTPGGSTNTASIGSAIKNAADKLTKELLKLAGKLADSPLRGAKPDEVMLHNGGLFLKADPNAGHTYGAILADSGALFLEAKGSTTALTLWMKYSMASYGAHFCEVAVHEQTRQVRVRRFVSAYDCGRILNLKTAQSQIIGGITMGIGMALLEETMVDERTGRLMNPTLAEYHVPVNADIPAIEVYFLDKPDPLTTMGVKCVGEIGIVGAAAAVANAVFNATGIRVRSLPITVDKLL